MKVIAKLERAKRFELSTLTLARLCSTPELRPHSGSRPNASRVIGQAALRAGARRGRAASVARPDAGGAFVGKGLQPGAGLGLGVDHACDHRFGI